MCEEEQVSVFGTSAKYLALLEKEGVKPKDGRALDKLRAILSTGSPLAPDSFDFVYRDIKTDVQLASISGGTDIISCFALGNPTGPVYRGDGDRGFQVGRVINYQEFVSTGKTVKSSFINHGNKDWATHAVVIDNHHSGKDLMGFSGYSDANFATIEGEVLFPPGSRFVVTRVVDWTMSYSDMSLDVPQQKIKGDLKRRDQIGQELNNNLAPDQIQKLMDELAKIDKRIQDEHPTWKDEVKKANEAAKKSGYSKQKLSKIWVYMNEV